jgi:4-hydroxy-3-polyprenylbenzoate decarboxylase
LTLEKLCAFALELGSAYNETMKIVVGISGASGAVYGIRLLEVLNQKGVESHLVLTPAAKETIRLETDRTVEQVEALATRVYPIDDICSAIASGSFKTAGMVVVPCSIKSMSAIAHSYSDNLLVRAADVTLKERRRLVLAVRETPLHQGHIQTMLQLSEMGAIILPPVPAFYHFPKTVDDIVNHTVGKVLDLFEIEHNLFFHWVGAELGDL